MSCNICGQKMPNCDCTPREREMHDETEGLRDDIETRLSALERDHNNLCSRLLSCGVIHPYSTRWNRHDLPKMNEESRSLRRQRLADAVDRAVKALSDFDAKEPSR